MNREPEGEMEASFHYLLMASQSLFQRGVFARLRDTGLTSGQPKVLDYLGDHDGASQKEIAAGCHIEPASLTAVLNGMEAKGLIERRSLNHNRRTSHVFLTPRGAEMQRETCRVFTRMEQAALEGIPPEERLIFMQVLGRVYARLSQQKEEQSQQ